MEGPPLGPGGEDITWPDQVAPRGRKASSTRKIKPQTSNLNASPQPLQVLHEVYSKLRFHWSCVSGLGILAHPTGSVPGHNLASMDKEMVYVTKQMR